MTTFDYTLPYKTVNLRTHPHLYRTGKGEQGVLMVEPYKSELLPLWRFRTPQIATSSSTALFAKFQLYRSQRDFVGMDMARKFIQMGVTRARRYANHKGGRKYVVGEGGQKVELPRVDVEDEEKAEAARIFGEVLKVVREDEVYVQMMKEHKEKYAGEKVTGKRKRVSPSENTDGVKEEAGSDSEALKDGSVKKEIESNPEIDDGQDDVSLKLRRPRRSKVVQQAEVRRSSRIRKY
ncbi:hypothetical protein HDV00_006627 [Rhizophlyctis rosea]|nr:hypothetical protein HDV00_006627 [Rhizophlyctis rosea]